MKSLWIVFAILICAENATLPTNNTDEDTDYEDYVSLTDFEDDTSHDCMQERYICIGTFITIAVLYLVVHRPCRHCLAFCKRCIPRRVYAPRVVPDVRYQAYRRPVVRSTGDR